MTGPAPFDSRTHADSPLGSRNPTVKLALVFVVSTTMLFVFDPMTPTVLYALALAAVLSSTRMPARTLLLAHIPFAAFATGLLVVNALSRPGETVWDYGVLRVTGEGLTVGASLAMRTLLVGVLSIGFIASTDPVSLMNSLHQNARLSPRLTYAMMTGYRMLQEMPREWETIRQAQAVRTSLRDDGKLPTRVRDLRPAAFTLLVVAVRRGERMAQALESRGLGLTPRTTWRPVPVRFADLMMAVVVLTVLYAVLWLSHTLGSLHGLGTL